MTVRKDDDNISLAEVIQEAKIVKDELIKRKYLVIIATVSAAAVAFLFSLTVKPLYSAKLTFLLEENEKGGTINSYLGLASQLGLSNTLHNSYGADNVIELLKSRKIVRDALCSEIRLKDKKMRLIDYYISALDMKGPHGEKLVVPLFTEDSIERNSLQTNGLINHICDDIINNLTVDRVNKQSNILFISYNSSNEMLAKVLVNAALNSLSSFYIEGRTRKSKDALSFAQHRSDSVRIELDKAELVLARVKDATRNVVKAEAFLNEAKLRRDVEILNIMYGEVIKNLELSKFSLLSQTPLFQVLDQPVLPLDKRVKFGKRLAVTVGVLLGLFFSVIYVILAQKLRDIQEKLDN